MNALFFFYLNDKCIIDDVVMREDIANVFSVLPFGVDVKHHIYAQMCKHVFTMSPALKQDLLTYMLLNKVICVYQAELATDYMDQNYFMYSLYNDLIHGVNTYDTDTKSDFLVNNGYGIDSHHFSGVLRATASCYPIVTRRIRHFWRMLSADQRLCFIKFLTVKFRKKCLFN